MSFTRLFVQAYNKKAAGNAKGGNQKSKKFELTEEQKQEIREAFDLFDTDGSGRPLILSFLCQTTSRLTCSCASTVEA